MAADQSPCSTARREELVKYLKYRMNDYFKNGVQEEKSIDDDTKGKIEVLFSETFPKLHEGSVISHAILALVQHSLAANDTAIQEMRSSWSDDITNMFDENRPRSERQQIYNRMMTLWLMAKQPVGFEHVILCLAFAEILMIEREDLLAGDRRVHLDFTLDLCQWCVNFIEENMGEFLDANSLGSWTAEPEFVGVIKSKLFDAAKVELSKNIDINITAKENNDYDSDQPIPGINITRDELRRGARLPTTGIGRNVVESLKNSGLEALNMMKDQLKEQLKQDVDVTEDAYRRAELLSSYFARLNELDINYEAKSLRTELGQMIVKDIESKLPSWSNEKRKLDATYQVQQLNQGVSPSCGILPPPQPFADQEQHIDVQPHPQPDAAQGQPIPIQAPYSPFYVGQVQPVVVQTPQSQLYIPPAQPTLAQLPLQNLLLPVNQSGQQNLRQIYNQDPGALLPPPTRYDLPGAATNYSVQRNMPRNFPNAGNQQVFQAVYSQQPMGAPNQGRVGAQSPMGGAAGGN